MIAWGDAAFGMSPKEVLAIYAFYRIQKIQILAFCKIHFISSQKISEI